MIDSFILFKRRNGNGSAIIFKNCYEIPTSFSISSNTTMLKEGGNRGDEKKRAVYFHRKFHIQKNHRGYWVQAIAACTG